MGNRIQWHLEVWDIGKLKPYDKNPRIIKEAGLDELKRSFDEIGFAQPVNVNRDGTILSGHARVMQLKREGVKDIEVYVPDRELTPKQEEAVVVRMNKNIAGNWDFDILANEFEMEDLLEWGFNEGDLGIIDYPENGDNESNNPSPPDYNNREIDTENFGNDLRHTCPQCGFEFNG